MEKASLDPTTEKEDLLGIYYAIAKFLEHQRFSKTYQVFKEEYQQRLSNTNGPNNKKIIDTEQNNNHNIKITAESLESFPSIFINKPSHIKLPEDGGLYHIKPTDNLHLNEQNQSDFLLEKNEKRNSNPNNNYLLLHENHQVTTASLKNDYRQLKSKFLELQKEHNILMNEIQEKAKYFIDFKESFATPKKTNSNENIKSNIEDCQIVNIKNSAKTKTHKTLEIMINHNTNEPNKIGYTDTKDAITNTVQSEEHINKKTLNQNLTDATFNNKIPCTNNVKNNLSYSKMIKQYQNGKKRTRLLIHSAPLRSMTSKINKALLKFPYSTPSSPKNNIKNNFFDLNYKLLKKDLASLPEISSYLFQALRWRLTRSGKEQRKLFLKSLICNDVLNFELDENKFDNFMKENTQLKEAVFRFINTLACFKQGRDYLSLKKNSILKKHVLPEINLIDQYCITDDLTAIIAISVTQKLSLNKKLRIVMIEENILPTILQILNRQLDRLSPNSLENLCALLMNLCLTEEGKKQCAENPTFLINTFMSLIKDANIFYMPYINGALFCLLNEETIKNNALNLKLDVCLVKKLQTSKDIFLQNQIKSIIQKYFTAENNIDNNTLNNNNDNEFDYEVIDTLDFLDPVLDQDDYLIGSEQGENLLMKYKIDQKSICESLCQKCKLNVPLDYNPTTPVDAKNANSNTSNKDDIEKIEKSAIIDQPIIDNKNGSKISININKESEISHGLSESEQNSLTDIKAFNASEDTPLHSINSVTDLYLSDKITCTDNRRFQKMTFSSRSSLATLKSVCDKCSCFFPTKYSCKCFEAIKKSLEDDERDNLPLNSSLNDCKCINPLSKKSKSFSSLFSPKPESDVYQHVNGNSVMESAFKYNINETISDLWNQRLFNCICYREAFISRPKLNRTPPL